MPPRFAPAAYLAAAFTAPMFQTRYFFGYYTFYATA